MLTSPVSRIPLADVFGALGAETHPSLPPTLLMLPSNLNQLVKDKANHGQQ
jgi:hypothetical protein